MKGLIDVDSDRNMDLTDSFNLSQSAIRESKDEDTDKKIKLQDGEDDGEMDFEALALQRALTSGRNAPKIEQNKQPIETNPKSDKDKVAETKQKINQDKGVPAVTK